MFARIKTLDEIVAPFVQVVEDLKAFRAQTQDRIEVNSARISSLKLDSMELAQQDARAADYQESIARFLGKTP